MPDAERRPIYRDDEDRAKAPGGESPRVTRAMGARFGREIPGVAGQIVKCQELTPEPEQELTPEPTVPSVTPR